MHPDDWLPSFQLESISRAIHLRGQVVDLVPGALLQRTSAAVLLSNDAAMAAWFAKCRASGHNAGWLGGGGGRLVIDTAQGFGCDDTVDDTADRFTLYLEDIDLQLDVPMAQYGKGVVRLCGNNISIVILGHVTISRPFQPQVPIDGDLTAYRNIYGEPYGISFGGLGRYSPASGQTIATNYRGGAHLICFGQLTIRNMAVGIHPVFVSSDLKVGGPGSILVTDYSDTACLPDSCGTMGDWSNVETARGGDDGFFAYHPYATPWVGAGLWPSGGSLHNSRFSLCRGKGFGFGGYGDVIVRDVFCDANWAGGYDIEFGPYDSDGHPTWAPNSGRVTVSAVLVSNPGNVQFPSASLPQYRTPNTSLDYAGGYINESANTIYGPSRLIQDDIFVINPAGPAFVFDTAQHITGCNLRVEPGSTVLSYAEGLVTPIARVAPQVAAVRLRDGRDINLDVQALAGPRGEQFANLYQVQGGRTSRLILSGGDRHLGGGSFAISDEVPSQEVLHGNTTMPDMIGIRRSRSHRPSR